MKKIGLFICLIWRAWPLLVTLLIMSIHFALSEVMPGEIDKANKFIGAATQVVGGLFVLLSIKENLRLLRNQTFPSVIASWLHEFWPFERSPVISMAAGVSAGLVGSAMVSIAPLATKNEERVTELERQLVEVHKTLKAQDASLHRRVAEVSDKLEIAIRSIELTIKQTAKKLEIVTIEGFKKQIFGIILVIYSAITGILPLHNERRCLYPPSSVLYVAEIITLKKSV